MQKPAEPVSHLIGLQSETKFVENIWIDSCKNLNDWDSLGKKYHKLLLTLNGYRIGGNYSYVELNIRFLEHYSNNEDVADAMLLAECSWRSGQWGLTKDCITQLEAYGNPDNVVRTQLIKIMSFITSSNANADTIQNIEEAISLTQKFLISRWKRFPLDIVSNSHIQLLADIHFLSELRESNSILKSLMHGTPDELNSRKDDSVMQISKLWRTYPASTINGINTHMDIFNWRFQFFLHLFDSRESTKMNQV